MPRIRGWDRGEWVDLPIPETQTWDYRPGSEISTKPYRPVRPSGGPKYDVKPEDVIFAGGAAFASMYADEAALWLDAAKLARQFNKDVKSGEKSIDVLNRIRDYFRQQPVQGRMEPFRVWTGDNSEVPFERVSAIESEYGIKVPLSRGGYYGVDRRRKRDYNVEAAFTSAYWGTGYPGKRPPGWHPGLGPGGTRALGRGKTHSVVRYERT